jgi:hypothetical protein
MIEQKTIQGRKASVGYFDMDFQPVDDLTKPHFAKIHFEDGEVLLLANLEGIASKLKPQE